MNHNYYVYIATNDHGNVMYIGVTNNLKRRMYEHRQMSVDGFTKKYNIHKLVYYEMTSDINAAIAREKQLKKWSRSKKNMLVESFNPEWKEITLD